MEFFHATWKPISMISIRRSVPVTFYKYKHLKMRDVQECGKKMNLPETFNYSVIPNPNHALACGLWKGVCKKGTKKLWHPSKEPTKLKDTDGNAWSSIVTVQKLRQSSQIYKTRGMKEHTVGKMNMEGRDLKKSLCRGNNTTFEARIKKTVLKVWADMRICVCPSKFSL